MTDNSQTENKNTPQIEYAYTGKLNSDEFVGLKFEDGKLKINFPLGYKPAGNEKEKKKDILNLISVLSSYNDHKESYINKSDSLKETDATFPIHAYLFIINNFLNNGYYIEREVLYKRGKNGKINWSRTIKQIRPQIDNNDNIVYLDFITRKTNYNESELITLIHKYCVYESFSKIGFLFSSFMPQKSPLKYNANLFKTVIKTKMTKTFNEKNQLLFKNMLDIINYIDSNGEDKTFHYGTKHFEHVWESLVDTVFGETDKDKFYPKCFWILFDDEQNEHEINYQNDIFRKYSLRLDTVMIKNRSKPGQKIFVLDSKYYRYGISNIIYDLPGSDSIIKQIAYAEFIEKGEKSIPSDVRNVLNKEEIYNAFILPYNKSEDEQDIKCFGYAKCNSNDGNKKYHKIYGIMLDVKSIMYRHIPHDKQMIEQLADKIEKAAGYIR